MNELVTVAFVVASAAVAYIGFCRLIHMSESTTKREVRWVFSTLVVAALANLFAVGAWHYEPQWPALVMVAAMALVLLVSRRLWAAGHVPAEYRK